MTRQAIMLAGEELMGWRGIEAVSVRDINEKAQQKNTSAIRYYFTNKQGLLQAILDYRMVPLDEKRRQRLDHLKSTKEPQDISLMDLVKIQLLPLAEAVLCDISWRNYILLLAQVVSAHGVAYESLWREKYDKTSVEIIQAMRLCSAEQVSTSLWQQRIQDMITFCIGSLCERCYKMNNPKPALLLDDASYLQHLVSTACAMLVVATPLPDLDKGKI